MLLPNQIEFLIDNFFDTHEARNVNGWRSIATNLIAQGQCVVAGEGSIWIGGIGNFIHKGYAKDFVGCSILKFDVKEFVKSVYYHEIKKGELERLNKLLNNLNQKIIDVNSL